MKISKLISVCAALTTLTACASIGEEAGHFGYAAMSPVRDFNIGTKPIPQRLQYLQDPFGRAGYEQSYAPRYFRCQSLLIETRQLYAAVQQNQGRIVGFRRNNNSFTGRVGNVRDSVIGTVATAFTPYRGVLRQVTGASAKEQRARQANERAYVRIGYLVGQGRAMGCPGF